MTWPECGGQAEDAGCQKDPADHDRRAQRGDRRDDDGDDTKGEEEQTLHEVKHPMPMDGFGQRVAQLVRVEALIR
ncbi:hypothetical protein ACVWZV_001042 [Bradyrhizobium sp. GM5.1]